MNHIWKYIAFFTFMVCTLLANCQEIPGIVSFDPGDYHGLGQNWDSTIGCDGSIYTANTDGILIYNGISWRKMRLPDDVVPRSIHTGSDCKIYIGGYETFGFIDDTQRSNLKFTSLSDSILSDSKQEIWSMNEYKGQIIFQSFAEVYLYDYNSIIQYHPPSNIILGNIVHTEYLIPSIDNRVYSFDEGEFNIIDGSQKLPKEVRISALCPYHDNKILVGTLDHGLFIIEGTQCRPLSSGVNDEFKDVQVNRILRLKSGLIVIGTILNGIYIINESFDVVHRINKTSGLSNNTVLSLLELNNGDMMAGLDKGVDIIQLSSSDRFYYDKHGKLGTVYTSIRYKDRLYLGTNQGVYVSGSNGVFSLLPDTQGQVWHFFVIDDILLCGHNNGLLRIDLDGVTMVYKETGVSYIDKANESVLILSTYTGLVTLSYINGSFLFSGMFENIILNRFILHKELLVGVSLIDGLNVIEFTSDYSKIKSRIQYREIDSVKVNSDIILINYHDSLFIYHNENYYSCHFGSFKDVSNKEVVNTLHRLSHNELVVSDRSVVPLYHHTVFNTINDREKPDKILVGIDDGYKIISIEQEQNLKPDTIGIKIGYGSTSIGDAISDSDEAVVLAPNLNDLQILLASEEKPANIKNYQYRLIGWDDSWIDIPEDGKLVFRNLHDGEYNLMIRNMSGNKKELFKFKIEPHWYESYTGYFLYFILAGIVAFMVKRRIQRSLEAKLKKLEIEKQQELDKEIIKSRNEKLEKEIVYKTKMLANSTMTLIQKNKVLNELKDYLSTLKSNEEASIKIKSKIMHQIERNINSEEEWEIFEKNFAEVHDDFLTVIKTQFSEITASELRLAAYIKMNLSSKEIAPLLNISIRSVENKRYRLRKKMGVPHDISIAKFLMRY